MFKTEYVAGLSLCNSLFAITQPSQSSSSILNAKPLKMKSLTTLAALLVHLAPTNAKPPMAPDQQVYQWMQNQIICANNPVLDHGRLTDNSFKPVNILPFSRKNPDEKMQRGNSAILTANDRCAMFNFELDSEKTFNRYCNLIFAFPSIGQIKRTGVYKYKGPKSGAHFDFIGYGFDVWGEEGKTSFNQQPDWQHSFPNPPPIMKPGYTYMISQGPCGVEKNYGKWKLAVSMCVKDASFLFPQFDETCPLGFFVVTTDRPPKKKEKRDEGYGWGRYAIAGRDEYEDLAEFDDFA